MLIAPDDDQLRLFELFEVLPADQRSEMLQSLFVQACMSLAGNDEAARYERSWGGEVPPVEPTPELLTAAFLARCMPPLPCGFCESDEFRYAYLDSAASRIEGSALRVVLGSSGRDEQHATEWTSDLCECAAEVGASYMQFPSADPEGEEPFVGREAVLSFIRSWRMAFDAALLRLAAEARPKP